MILCDIPSGILWEDVVQLYDHIFNMDSMEYDSRILVQY